MSKEIVGTSTEKGFIKGIHDNFSPNAENAAYADEAYKAIFLNKRTDSFDFQTEKPLMLLLNSLYQFVFYQTEQTVGSPYGYTFSLAITNSENSNIIWYSNICSGGQGATHQLRLKYSLSDMKLVLQRAINGEWVNDTVNWNCTYFIIGFAEE